MLRRALACPRQHLVSHTSKHGVGPLSPLHLTLAHLSGHFPTLHSCEVHHHQQRKVICVPPRMTSFSARFVPPAYRKYPSSRPEENEKENKLDPTKSVTNREKGATNTLPGGPTKRHHRRPWQRSCFPSARSGQKSLSASCRSLFERKKPRYVKHGTIRRKTPSSAYFNENNEKHGRVDLKKLNQLENAICRDIDEYNARLRKPASHDVIHYTEVANKRDAERISSSASFIVGTDSGQSVARGKSGPSLGHLLETEELFSKIATNFKALVTGWSNVAELICTARRMQNLQEGDSQENNSTSVAISDYNNAIMQAERHLESFESFYFDRINAIEKGKLHMENLHSRKSQESANHSTSPTSGKFESILEVFFPNTNTTSTNEFDKSWQGDKANENDSNGKSEVKSITTANYDDILEAHENVDCIPDTSLYEYVLLAHQASFCFGQKAKEESAQRSNRLLGRWISLFYRSRPNVKSTSFDNNGGAGTSTSSSASNFDVKYPQQKLFHIVMRQNIETYSAAHVKQAEKWLREMQSLKRDGWDCCGPDVNAYNIVLLGYRYLSTFRHKFALDEKMTSTAKYQEEKNRSEINAADEAEKILLEVNELVDQGISPNQFSLNCVLVTFAKSSLDNEAFLCQRTDRLLFKTLGETNFRKMIAWIGNEEYANGFASTGEKTDEINSGTVSEHKPVALGSYSSLPLETYHWLVEIYSASEEASYIKRAVNILDRMIEIQATNHSNETPQSISSGTFNSVLRGLKTNSLSLQGKKDSKGSSIESNTFSHVHDVIDETNPSLSRNMDFSLKSYPINGFSTVDNAEKGYGYLDAMVQYESSLPTPMTFLSLLHLWEMSDSPDAGDYADKILSRMEILGACLHNEAKPSKRAYFLALKCWSTAAKAGRSGAAERAQRLLVTIEAQCRRNDFLHEIVDNSKDSSENNDNELYDSSLIPDRSLYHSVIKVCAATTKKSDMPRALDIAFDTCDKMVVNGSKPNRSTLELLRVCAEILTEDIPDEKPKWLQKIRHAAKQHRIDLSPKRGRRHTR